MAVRKFLLAMAAATALSGPVLAADIIEEPAPAPIPVETSGWYLRGDVGYVFKSHNEGDWDFYNILPGVEGIDDTYRYDDLDLKDALSLGGGIGYRFNETLRTDATFDWFQADTDGGTACPFMIRNDDAHGNQPFQPCDYEHDSSVDVYTLMANAYVDMPFLNLGGLTPYLGAGIGAAYVDYAKLKEQENCPECPAGYVEYSTTKPGDGDWRLAGSVMAGVGYNFTQNLALDVGYKYTRIGSGDAWKYDDLDKSGGASGTQYRDNGFDVHAIRAGLRYEFF